MSGIYPEFFLVFWNLSCPEFVQFYLSGICPEYFHVRNMSSFICPEFVQNFFMSRICLEKISGIFHVQNLSSLFVQILSMSKKPDKFWTWKKIFRTYFRHAKNLDSNFDHFSEHFPDIFRTWNKFRTNSGQFRWHFPDISFL